MLHLQYGNLTIQMNEIDLIELTNRGKKVASCEPINYIWFNIILNYESTIEYDTDRYKKYNFVKYTLGEQCQMISFLENNYKLDRRKMFQMMEEVRIQTQLLFNTNTHKTKKKLSVDLFKKNILVRLCRACACSTPTSRGSNFWASAFEKKFAHYSLVDAWFWITDELVWVLGKTRWRLYCESVRHY